MHVGLEEIGNISMSSIYVDQTGRFLTYLITNAIFQIKNLSGSTVPEYKVQEIKRSRLILLHYGIFKIGWDWMILLCTFYIAITVPYNATFGIAETHDQRASIVTDVIVEILLITGQSAGVCGLTLINYYYHRRKTSERLFCASENKTISREDFQDGRGKKIELEISAPDDPAKYSRTSIQRTRL